ncbi:MAG: flagellar basal body-associated FliL family protein [Rhodobacteraceae bacterium]|nr:flagellar basal body-associated FliL family protein [Paracoccaceae bacterium]
MMRKLLPLLLALIGLGGGVGLGIVLRPVPEAEGPASPCGDMSSGESEGGQAQDSHGAPEDGEEGLATKEYVKLNNQFIVPVVDKEAVQSMVILSISLEVGVGESDKVYKVEPKLRDSFLQVLFDHANAGGFDGNYTNSNNMDVLRTALLETGQGILGKMLTDVLIVDIVRQESN